MISTLADCSNLENEFWTHVSSQDELPIAELTKPVRPKTVAEALSGDDAEPTEDSIVLALNTLADAYDPGDPSKLQAYIVGQILAAPELVHQLRLLISVSDKRLYLDLSYIFSRTPHPGSLGRTLCGCLPHKLTRHSTSFFVNMLKSKSRPVEASAAAVLIAEYLLKKGLTDILRLYASLDSAARDIIVTNLVAPKEAQQTEAKRRGHGPEAALAKLVRALNVTFLPRDKDTKPMAEHDPNVDRKNFRISPRDADETFSADLVLFDERGNLRVCVVGLIHSSDPGQFGVDKSNTVIDIRRRMNEFNSGPTEPVEIWGIVDGVGYSENKAGTIHKMLPHFHCFVQMKSLWKAALRLHVMGLTKIRAIKLDMNFYSDTTARQMFERYLPEDVAVISTGDEVDSAWRSFVAGAATLYF